MSIVRQIPKVSQKKIDNALSKALLEKINFLRDYSISGDVLRIYMDSINLSNMDAAKHLVLPSLEEIFSLAKSKYKNFEYDKIRQLEYVFDGVRFLGDTHISANFSNINMRSCDFDNLCIHGGEKITLYDCDHIEPTFKKYSKVEIISQKIKLMLCRLTSEDDISLIADNIDVNSCTTLEGNNIDIKGKFLTFIDGYLKAENLNLKYDLIEVNNSFFKSDNAIRIYCKYEDSVENVEAPSIYYNDIDITYSDGIVKPKLMSKLVDELSALRDLLKNTIDKDVQEVAKTRRQNLEESSITKILSRKNT